MIVHSSTGGRPRGTLVYPMPESVCGPYEVYALAVAQNGEVRMVHTEGVAYAVSDETPWRWNDYREVPTYTPAELLTLAFTSKPVDLADWVRVFGHRLESNFHLIRQWCEAPAPAPHGTVRVRLAERGEDSRVRPGYLGR